MASPSYPDTERYAAAWSSLSKRNRGLRVAEFVAALIAFVPTMATGIVLFATNSNEIMLALLSVATLAMVAFAALFAARYRSEHGLADSMGTTIDHMRAAVRLLSLRPVVGSLAMPAISASDRAVAARLDAARSSFERRLDVILSLSEGLDGASGSRVGQRMISNMIAEAGRIEIEVAAASEAAADSADLSRMLNDQARDKARAMILARMPKA